MSAFHTVQGTPAAAAPTGFSRILIANRGEIALRVLRSARALGYGTVAVYSSADADAPHVLQADSAVWIGEVLPAQSYLNIEAIVQAARRSGADAVHPGYGFLAENAAFAQACRDAGLVFIGPSPESIRAMGDKAGAKALMQQAGVPCIPGYLGDDQSPQALLREAGRIGYPVMIKATQGGGGRGMRLVTTEQEFPELLRQAQSEAAHAFGDATVILERAIAQPRHVEIQVFCDRHGNAIHLGERDCSVQRRHQKLIEEAPSPAVDAALRERMGAAAVAAVRAIGYEGAGTLEFLLDAEGRFYFMEMNTRLQVEHPVTEAVTGLDLVEWQLRVAAGEPLPLRQDQVCWHGHAIEVRLCAEDPQQGFLPQSGTMELWRMPPLLRVEHALASGAQVSPYYDSMIARLVAHGATRAEACRRLLHGLEAAVALGVPTNQRFLADCLRHPVFAAGQATTGFIAAHQERLLARDGPADPYAVVVASLLLAETADASPATPDSRRLPHGLPLLQRFDLDGRREEVTLLQHAPGQYTVQRQERAHAVGRMQLQGDALRWECDGLVEHAAWTRQGARLLFHYRGRAYGVDDHTRAAPAVRAGAGPGDGRLRATMNGRIVAVLARVGDRLRAGQPLVTLEAMKIEHAHAAPVDGILRALHVAAGDQVSRQALLAEIEAQPGA